MNKILTDTCQCGCNPELPENLLKITAGNDFSIKLQLTEKIDDNWVHYDMTDMSNVTVSVMSPNNTATELDYIIDAAGNIQAIVDAQKFQSYIIYGIEVLWTDATDVVSVDKRAFAPNVFAFVNSSMEATDSSYEYTSDNPYEYNISMSNDVVCLSIGYIPDDILSDYYTKDEIDSTLENYATDQDVADAIADIDIDTSKFYTKSEIDTTLTSYGTSIIVAGDRINAYPTIEKVFSLRNSSDDSISSFAVSAFSKHNESGGGWHIVPSEMPTGLILKPTVETIYHTEDRVAAIESDYITSTSLNSTLNDYVTDSELVTSLNPYATKQYVDDAIDNIDSGVSEEDWDNSNEAVAQELVDNRLEHISINNNFNNYYTKTEADSRYATSSWANDKFVTKSDDVNRQEAIANAFSTSVQSTTIHNIVQISQTDYDALTTKDTNTLYIIL